jgi:hypothetical protein
LYWGVFPAGRHDWTLQLQNAGGELTLKTTFEILPSMADPKVIATIVKAILSETGK